MGLVQQFYHRVVQSHRAGITDQSARQLNLPGLAMQYGYNQGQEVVRVRVHKDSPAIQPAKESKMLPEPWDYVVVDLETPGLQGGAGSLFDISMSAVILPPVMATAAELANPPYDRVSSGLESYWSYDPQIEFAVGRVQVYPSFTAQVDPILRFAFGPSLFNPNGTSYPAFDFLDIIEPNYTTQNMILLSTQEVLLPGVLDDPSRGVSCNSLLIDLRRYRDVEVVRVAIYGAADRDYTATGNVEVKYRGVFGNPRFAWYQSVGSNGWPRWSWEWVDQFPDRPAFSSAQPEGQVAPLGQWDIREGNPSQYPETYIGTLEIFPRRYVTRFVVP